MLTPKVIILLLLASLACSSQVPPFIYSVSSSPSAVSAPVSSSLRGGKLIYIKAIGHNPNPSQNIILVGTIPCIVPADGVADTYISCVTGDSGSTADIYSLPVTLIAYSTSFTTKWPYVVHYVSYATPQLFNIYPTAAYGGQNVNLQGIHKIKDIGDGMRILGDITKLSLGSDLCSRFDVFQSPIQPYWYDQILCVKSNQQQAGKYNISEQLVIGFADRRRYLRRSSFDPNEYFEFTAIPTVTSISPNNGNIGGQYLTIQGNGFSPSAANNTVSVDGNDCLVTASSNNQIQCTLAPKDNTKSAVLTTNSSSQANGYFSGAGVKYARYTLSDGISTIPYFTSAYRGAQNTTALGTPQEVGYRADLREGDVYGQNYAQTWNGYFTAPVSGSYTFRGTADDIFAVYLAQTYGSSELPADPLIYSNSYQIKDNFYTFDIATAQASVVLQAGKSYYFEAYHINGAGGGHFNLEVDMPNTDKTTSFQVHQVDYVTLNSTVQPQVVVYNMTGGSSGTIQLGYTVYGSNGYTVISQTNVNITYGCSATSFRNALNNFDFYSNYIISVTRTIYGASKNVLSNTTGAAYIEYSVSIYKLRPASVISKSLIITNIDYTGKVVVTNPTTHSPVISGTFTLKIAGVDILVNMNSNIPFNVGTDVLQAAIRNSSITGFDFVEVTQYAAVTCEYSCTYIIQYKGFNNDVPSIVPNGALLSGGTTSPTISYSKRRSYSSSVAFDPVDYRFLNTKDTGVNVLVKNNGIPAICNGTCSYTFATLSQIQALSLSGSTLLLNISDPTSKNFAASDISIKVGGQPCTVSGSDIMSLSCQLKKNTDNTPTLVAGTFTPIVSVKNIGILGLKSGINPISVNLVATSLSVASGGNNGGILITLVGKGFPLDKSQMSITICSKTATIKAISNIDAQFYLPSCASTGSNPVTIAVGSLNDSSLNFSYVSASQVAPTILSLNPPTANPGVKGTLEINGQNFGTNASLVKVFLSNQTGKIYQLTILSLNETYIKVGLPGGQAGDFKVEVNTVANGDSVSTGNASAFSYVFGIASVSPSTGSYNGGTLLTITGNSFSSDTQNTLVYIGDTLNWFCNIESVNATQIKCRTPAISSAYTAGTPVKIYASTRLIILNTCNPGPCTFTYMASATSPALTASTASTVNGGTDVTLTGTNFLDANNYSEVVLTNQISSVVTVLPTTNRTSTSITFNVGSNIVSGTYTVKVRNAIGQTNTLPLSVTWNLPTVSWNAGGSISGGIASISGSGFPSSIDGVAFSISILSGKTAYPLNIISCCGSNTVTIEIPSAPTGTAFTLAFVGPVNSINKTYTLSNSYTPTANINAVTSANNQTVGPKTITFAATNSVNATITGIKLVSTLDSSHTITVASGSWNTTGNGSAAVTTFAATLNAGSYKLLVSTTPFGYISMNSTVDNTFPTNVITSNQQVSFNGGSFTIAASYLSPVSYITVNGFKGTITSYSSSSVTYSVPALVTPDTQSAFNLVDVSLLPTSQFTYFSDSNVSSAASASFDGSVKTAYSSANAICWVGLDAGAGLTASVSRISFFASLDWANVAQYILYSTFQGSNDNSTWVTLVTVDQTVHSGWNVFSSQDTTGYRYIRFLHNSTSKCSLAEFQLYGILYSTITANLASQFANVAYNDGLNTQLFNNLLEYKQANTSIITLISPRYGDISGGYTITLTGTNLNSGTAVITIDGITCTNVVSNATTITCSPGARTVTPTVANTFFVTIGGNKVILQDTFLYVLKWSNPTTWGVDSAPIDNDLVYVPLGTTLLVDVNTPILKGIAVEGGTLAFSDDLDLTVQAGFITMNRGNFIAGTKKHPHSKKLTFVMHGDYYGVQQPMFGNKGIGCLNCKFSMYGTPRVKTWTTITATINPGDTSFVVKDTVDWVNGQQIVVASTSFIHTEAEQKTVVSVTGNTVTVDSAFQNKHVSTIEQYGDKYLVMQAEVGLLTRNIKVMGSSDSVAKKYGSHLMLSGQADSGFEAQVAYSEFTNCGQPKILGRYCIHFHMAGDIPTSFAKGNAVHDSFARVITIHGVHYLTVEENVGYKVSGHNFFVQDGIETHNIIRNNLAISSLAVTNMLQTDTSVASFWITNPTNDFYGNRAAGGDFYGIWYEIKPNPDGPSATMDVCPTGNPLGYVTNNIAHSNTRFGLRVFQLQPRLYPCKPVRNDSNAVDSWADNPSIQSVFSNFTVYKNLEDGVLAEQVGNVVFDNFVIAENYHSGIQFYLANFTKEPPTINNSIIVGKSNTNAHTDISNYTNKMSAGITGRSGVCKFSNTRFYSYPNGSILFQTCRLCDDPDFYTNVGTEVIMQKLSFSQINGKFLYMINMKRDVIYDLDGSLSHLFDGTNRSSATIVYGFPHIANTNQNLCPYASVASAWDNAVMCGPAATIRRVLFGNIINKQLFVSQQQKAIQLTSINDTVDPNATNTTYSSVTSYGFKAMQPMKETPNTWSMPYITGRIYNIWWGTGIDFTHLSIYTSPIYAPADLGIIFRFNYSENRQKYNVGPMRGGVKKLTALDYFTEITSAGQLDINNCTNGQYYHDNQEGAQRKLAVCISGKNRTQYEYTQVNGIVCQINCPLPAGTFIKENFIRKWSNTTQWQGGVLPAAGTNLVVNGNWTVILDIDPNPLNNLTIDGTIVADDTRDVNITANFIHIRAGNFTAGSKSNPFLHKLNFQINGQKTTTTFIIDQILTANKLFVVTGSLNLFGNTPNTVSTYLSSSALQGSSTLNVGSSDGWQAGDTLVLSPSFATYSEYQKVTIQTINADGSITLAAPLNYTHYGSGSLTVNNNYGQLDTRTRVGHVNRNITIVPGPDAGWGFTLTVYGYMDKANVTRIGSVQLSGVQFQDGGQLETLNSPLVFLNLLGNTTSSVTSTSFVNCKANCIYVKNAQFITISNNVLYNAWVFGAQLSQIKSVTFANNVIIGVYEKPTLPQGSELVACVWVQEYVNPLTDAVAINNNYCLGSSQDGFAFPHIKCTQLQTNPFANNTVGSAQIGFILNTNGQNCQAFSYAKAFACKIGQICGAFGVSTLIFDHFLMADNGRSVTLKFGDGEGKANHTAFLYNSYISAVSRPDCAECYGPNATICSGNHGMRMLVPSANGEQTPKKFNSGFDVICKQPLYGSKSFLVNVTFDNYRQTYSGAIGSACSSNFALRPHKSGWDQSGSAYLFTSKCTNCDTSSYLFAPSPSKSQIGWFGGCGDIECTGFQNYLVQDFDGTFLGSKATIIPNNSVIASNEANCTFVSSMNAHLCNRSDFGVLEYQNVAADFNTRIMWPVNLFYEGSNYTTATNGWREWDWLGLQPQNRRFGRFVSIVRLNQTYNMTFASQAPSQLQLQLQKRLPLGESQNYVIARVYYPLPNAIRVKLNGIIVDPILLTDFNNTTSGTARNLDTTVCGSNIYFYTNRTIAFVVTSAIDCLITVEITESVQLTTHFSTDISNFFNSNSTITNFINNLCALLNIVDTSRVKVVGVFSGSTTVTAVVTPSNATNDNLTDISNTAASAIANGSFSSVLSNIGLGNVLSATTVYNNPTPGSTYPSNKYTGGADASGSGESGGSGGAEGSSSSKFSPAIIAGVAVAGVIFVVGVIITAVYLLRRRSKVIEEIVSHQDEVVQEKSVEKDKANFIFNETSEMHNESEIKIKAAKVNPKTLKIKQIEPSEVLDY